MPANLTPTYIAAENRYKKAVTWEEKLTALEEMLRTIPKHKGTEKMRADIKRRISKVKAALEQGSSQSKKGISFHVAKQGCAQCVLVGPPNSGKSSILNLFTNAQATIGDYPFTTLKPQPGMLEFENITFQIVDLPPISSQYTENWVPSVIRVSDLVLLTIANDEIDELDSILDYLEKSKIKLVTSIKVRDYQSPVVRLPTIILVTKLDLPDSSENVTLLKEIYGDYLIFPIPQQQDGLVMTLGKLLYKFFDFVRIYTKAPGKEAQMDRPIVFQRGASVLDAAREIHKDFAESLRYARVWGKKTFDGQRVQRDYILDEGDIIEFKV